jgi:hypothetical protein
MMTIFSRRTAIAAVCLGVAGAGVAAVYLLGPREPAALPVMPSVPHIAEDEALTDSHGLVSRDGPVLHLRMKSGELLDLTNHQQCGDLPCAAPLAVSYRYQGWDERIGGYLLQVSMANSQSMVLTYGDDDPILMDARHGAEAKEPLTMPSATPANVQTDSSLAEWLADLTSERDQNEKPLIAAHPDQAQRNGGKLMLTLEGRRQLVLEDDLVCGQLACPPQISRSYDYLGESPDGHFHVVRQQWNEAELGLLIGQDGNVLVTLSVPSFAPDGHVAVAAISDLEGNAPRRLEVWDLSKGKPALVYAIPAKDEDDTIYEVVGWLDAKHLRLKRGPWGSDRRSPMMLVGDNGGWHVEESDSEK